MRQAKIIKICNNSPLQNKSIKLHKKTAVCFCEWFINISTQQAIRRPGLVVLNYLRQPLLKFYLKVYIRAPGLYIGARHRRQLNKPWCTTIYFDWNPQVFFCSPLFFAAPAQRYEIAKRWIICWQDQDQSVTRCQSKSKEVISPPLLSLPRRRITQSCGARSAIIRASASAGEVLEKQIKAFVSCCSSLCSTPCCWTGGATFPDVDEAAERPGAFARLEVTTNGHRGQADAAAMLLLLLLKLLMLRDWRSGHFDRVFVTKLISSEAAEAETIKQTNKQTNKQQARC